MKDESGAVLLLVLVGLALLAAMAGIAMRLDRAGVQGLRAAAVLFDRSLTEDSALALIATRLGASGLPTDGQPVVLDVEGTKVQARIRAAEGLVNPAHARLPVLVALLQAKGASPDAAQALGRAVLAARARGQMNGPWDLAAVMAANPGLWAKLSPDVTFLGTAVGVNAAAAPPNLRDALAGVAAAGVDLTQAPMQRGLYEIDLALVPGGPVTRHSVLQDRAGHLHQITRSWPMETAP